MKAMIKAGQKWVGQDGVEYIVWSVRKEMVLIKWCGTAQRVQQRMVLAGTVDFTHNDPNWRSDDGKGVYYTVKAEAEEFAEKWTRQ